MLQFIVITSILFNILHLAILVIVFTRLIRHTNPMWIAMVFLSSVVLWMGCILIENHAARLDPNLQSDSTAKWFVAKIIISLIGMALAIVSNGRKASYGN